MRLLIKNYFSTLILLVTVFSLTGCGLTSCSSSSNSDSDSTTATATSLSIAPLNKALNKATQTQLNATADFSDNTKKDVTDLVTWSSSDTSIATVDTNGMLTTLSAGSFTVNAIYQDQSADLEVTVLDNTLVSLEFNTAISSVNQNTTFNLGVIGIFDDNSKADVTNQITWSSSNNSIVSVVSDGKFAALAAGTSTLTASMAGLQINRSITVNATELSAIEVELEGALAYVGNTLTLRATGLFSDNSKQDISDQVIWSSSDNAILEILENNQALAITGGEITLTATAGNITGNKTFSINSSALTSIDIKSENEILATGENADLVAIGTYEDGTQVNLTDQVTWNSSNSDVLEISNNLGYEGSVLAVDEGSGSVTATVGNVSGSLDLVVSNATLQKISITPPNQTLALNTTLQLVATGIYSDGTLRDITRLVTWESAATATANVSNDTTNAGLVYGISAGTVTVSAKLLSVSSSVKVTVTDASLTDIAIDGLPGEIASGITYPLEAIGIFSDGSRQKITGLVTWSSSDTSIATVSNAMSSAGLLNATGTGNVAIKATLINVSRTMRVDVVAKTLSSIEIYSAYSSLAAGTSTWLNAIGVYDDGTNADITRHVVWSSSNSAALSVSNIPETKGLAVAKSAGNSTITASFQNILKTININVHASTLSLLEITPQNVNLATGTFATLKATAIFSNDLLQDVSQQAIWQSSDTNAVFVSNAAGKNGFAYALATGSSEVSASFGGMQASSIVTVNSINLDGITILFEGASSIATGTSKLLRATGNYSDGSTQDISNQVTWQTTNTGYCAVSTGDSNYGLLTGLNAGLCTVSARMGQINSTLIFTVSDAVLESINVTPDAATLAVGTKIQYVATGHYSDNSEANISQHVTWQLANNSATISNLENNKGELTALTAGSNTVQAQWQGISASTSVTISTATLQSISLSPSTSQVAQGTTLNFQATGTYSDSSTQDITQLVLWHSSDNLVASIDNSSVNPGKLTALSTGTTSITASIDNISASVSIEVVSDPTAPISLALFATPYVIYHNGTDSTQITVNVQAVDAQATVADGTALEISIISGAGTLSSNSTSTVSGSASFSMTSTTKGITTVKVKITGTDIENFVHVYVTDDFSEVVGRSAFATGTLTDNMVNPGARFGLLLLNLSNRQFDLFAYRVLNGNSEIKKVEATTAEGISFLSDGNLEASENILVIYVSQESAANDYSAVFTLGDPVTQTIFNIGVKYQIR